MENYELKRLVDKMEVLPTLPSVVAQLLELTQDVDADAGTIARVIEADQALTARLLRIVNTSSFHFKTPITTVSRAVTVLGFKAVRCMALGMGVAKVLPKNGKNDAFPLHEFWKHALACAVCAEGLASRSPHGIDKDEAFVAGLLHDIGKVVFVTCFGSEYANVVARAKENNLPLIEAERAALSTDHCNAGKWLCERWGLPKVFTDAVWLHHQPSEFTSGSGINTQMIQMVQVADTMARQLMIGVSGNDQFDAVDERQLADVGVTLQAAAEIRQKLCKQVEERAAIIDLDISAAELYLESLQKANTELSRMSLKAEEQNARLERRVRRFRTLHEMNAVIGPNQSEDDVLRVLGHSLRDGFEIGSGMVFVVEVGARRLHGTFWKSGSVQQDIELSVTVNGSLTGEKLQQLDGSIRTILTQNSLKFDGATWLGSNIRDILGVNGFFLVPVVSEGRAVGQMLLDLRKAPIEFGEAEMSELLAFASAAGMAISRAQVCDALKRRSEELATAMWKREQAYKQLLHAERLASVGKMAAGAAHEINNPLAIISGRAEMLLQKAENSPHETPLRLIIDQCTRASKILNDLMRFARPALPRKEVAAINAVVYEVAGMFENRFQNHNIGLTCDFAENLPRVYIDKGQIQQVLVNLLINAEHAITPPGSIVLATSFNKPRNKVVITVTDTGCGIARDHLNDIFEPFFTTKEEGKGSGLGLSLAHGIITSHQGNISVESELGKGSTFIIMLPVPDDVENPTETVEPAPTPKPVPVPGKPKKRRILVVDDEEQMRALITEALTTMGYEVEQATNGLEALHIARTKRLDLITLDIRMPRMDGMSVLRALRERGPNVPVLVLTGLASDEEIESAKDLGVQAFIRKPFAVSELRDEVLKAFGEK